MWRLFLSRIQRLPAWLWAAVGVVLVFSAALAVVWWTQDRRTEAAVELDQAQASAEAANMVIEADRASTANRVERDEGFRNSQARAEEKIHEATRNRTSSLDTLFDELR